MENHSADECDFRSYVLYPYQTKPVSMPQGAAQK